MCIVFPTKPNSKQGAIFLINLASEVPPVVDNPPPAPEPDIAPPVPPTVDDFEVIPDVPSVPAPTWSDLNKKSKYELEQIGRTIGIELDRRLSHNKLVDQLLEAFASQ